MNIEYDHKLSPAVDQPRRTERDSYRVWWITLWVVLGMNAVFMFFLYLFDLL